MSMRNHRMALHQIPELGFQEQRTKDYLLQQLKGYSCRIHEVGQTGLLLYFEAGSPHTIAFRADMDALPITERTGLPFSSRHPGLMHACGHDGHMAIILGLAAYVNEHAASLTKNVVLIFQPSEESEGGARSIVESGLLQQYGVEAIFGLHLWPGCPEGEVFSRPNELMAMSSETDIAVKGKAVHVADSERGIDALQIACRYLKDVYDEEAMMDPDIYRLLKFGRIQSGTIRNVISDETRIEGTLRSYHPEVHARLKELLARLARKYDQEYGSEITIVYNDGYPPVINDAGLFKRMREIIPYLHVLERPVLQAEDFGVYTQHFPCMFFFLGVGNTPALHEATFDFNMDVLDKGLNLFVDILGGYAPISH